MTHFDRRDLLHSKKQVWGGYRNYSDLQKPICEFSMIFFGNSVWGSRTSKINFPNFRVRIFFSKII